MYPSRYRSSSLTEALGEEAMALLQGIQPPPPPDVIRWTRGRALLVLKSDNLDLLGGVAYRTGRRKP